MAMIQQLYDQNVITEEEYRAYDNMMTGHNVEVYFVKINDIEQMVQPYFDIEGILYSTDYGYAESKPFYCLRRRAES